MGAYYLGWTGHEALTALANTYVDAERYAMAMPVLTRAIAGYSANEGKDDYSAEMHNLKGICHYYANEFAESCTEYALAESYGMGDLKFMATMLSRSKAHLNGRRRSICGLR